jgi:ABC-2 type transport system ATP-binding protein
MLEVRHLSHSYFGLQVLWDVSFSLAPGEIVAYLGPNGSGKTTTIKIITGLVEPSGGRVLIDGRDTSEDAMVFRRRLGFVTGAGLLVAARRNRRASVEELIFNDKTPSIIVSL